MGAFAIAQFSIATSLSVPEIMCSPQQNEQLAVALSRVSRHFPRMLTEKQQDIAVFIGAVGTVALQQFRAYNERIAAENAKSVNATVI